MTWNLDTKKSAVPCGTTDHVTSVEKSGVFLAVNVGQVVSRGRRYRYGSVALRYISLPHVAAG
jgi:hypothetical protein